MQKMLRHHDVSQMNQLIQKMAFKDRSEDLLKGSISSSAAHRRFNQEVNGQENKSSIPSFSSDRQKKHPTTAEPQFTTPSKSHTLEQPDPSPPHITHNTSIRGSIPSWIMTPQQLQILSNFHTGLTPRHRTSDTASQTSQTTRDAAPKKCPRGKKSRSQNARPKSDDWVGSSMVGSSDESDVESQEYVDRFASDVLGVTTGRSLQHQQLIDRHKKRAQVARPVGKKKSSKIGEGIFGTRGEIEAILGQQEIQKRRQV